MTKRAPNIRFLLLLSSPNQTTDDNTHPGLLSWHSCQHASSPSGDPHPCLPGPWAWAPCQALGFGMSWGASQLGRSRTGTSTRAPESPEPQQSHPRPPPLGPCPAHWQLGQALAATQAKCQAHTYPVLLWQPWVWRTALMDRGLSPGTTSAWGHVCLCVWRSRA